MSAGRRPAPSPEQLRTVATVHLPYELRTLLGQVVILVRWSKARDVQWDALLEASLLHIRILHEFLFTKPSRDDVRAVHFADHWRPADHKVLAEDELRDLNAQLFHLVGRRRESRDWEVGRLTHVACSEFCEFVSVVDEVWQPHFTDAHDLARIGVLAEFHSD